MDRYQAREIVLKSSDISMGARMLYMALDNYQRDGTQCWPRQKTLREIVGCSSRSLQRHLAELIRAGLCAAKRTTPGGPNQYVLFHSTVTPQVALPHATGDARVTPQVARHKANQEEKPNTPLSPPRGACPKCGGNRMYYQDGIPKRCEMCRRRRVA